MRRVVQRSLFARIADLVVDDPKAPGDLSSDPRHLEKYGRDRQPAGVPRGSLGAFLAFVERRATATKPGNEVMEATAESGWTLGVDSETKLKKNASGEKEIPARS
jgi:hypothetical protein